MYTYENEKDNLPFNIGSLEERFDVETESNDDFVLIQCSEGKEFMYYTELSLLSIDVGGERYDMPAPALIGDFVRDCARLEIELLER